jgi:hypothetical protein
MRMMGIFFLFGKETLDLQEKADFCRKTGVRSWSAGSITTPKFTAS